LHSTPDHCCRLLDKPEPDLEQNYLKQEFKDRVRDIDTVYKLQVSSPWMELVIAEGEWSKMFDRYMQIYGR
jgi:hypothetical protein